MVIASLFLLLSCGQAPDSVAPAGDLLQLEYKVPLPGVKGRIDHLSWDPETHRLFVAALGNNSVEVLDLKKKERVHSITGLDEPQGVLWIPAPGRLLVANGGSGDCIFYDGQQYTELGRIALKKDADNIRYSPVSKLVYVGYGSGGIAVVDPVIIKQLSNLPLPGHPESFQLDARGHLFVNLPDKGQIVLVDLATLAIRDRWENRDAAANFPMALDDAASRLFVAYRRPAVVKVLDTRNGKVTASLPCVGDADDIFYDTARSLLIVTGGEGFIDLFRDGKPAGHVATRKGARTSLWLPRERELIVAVPARGGEAAALWVFHLAGT